MGVWNAIECWFLQTPSFGDKVICWYTGFTFKTFIQQYKSICLSSLSWGIPILIVQECQSYSQIHNCNYLSQIWQRAFARFLILPGELHLVGGGGPKPNCHIPGLGAPILYKLPLTVEFRMIF